jgi:hypothetical protein
MPGSALELAPGGSEHSVQPTFRKYRLALQPLTDPEGATVLLAPWPARNDRNIASARTALVRQPLLPDAVTDL